MELQTHQCCSFGSIVVALENEGPYLYVIFCLKLN